MVLEVGWSLLTIFRKNPAWPLLFPYPGYLEGTHVASQGCLVCEPLFILI